MSQENTVNPGVFPLLLFGYVLAVLGAELLIAPKAAGALVFAILVAGVAETIGGLWQISQGKTYFGSILATFGIWLIGLFLFETIGRSLGLVSAQAQAVFFLGMLIPIVLLAIPAFKGKIGWPTRCAFVTLSLLVLSAGLNFLLANDALRVAAGVFAWLSAVCIWILATENIVAIETP